MSVTTSSVEFGFSGGAEQPTTDTDPKAARRGNESVTINFRIGDNIANNLDKSDYKKTVAW